MSRHVALRSIHVWALSMVILSLVLVLGALSWGAVGPSRIGMMVRILGTDQATVTREFDLMATMQVTWIRADFDWSAIEANHGQFDWSYPDRVVKEASSRRMSVVGILSHTPVWARPVGTNSSTPPQQVSDFAAFSRAVAARYGPLGMHTWEIWNEPNINAFWQPAPDANAYGELFRAVVPAVRAVDPVAKLLIGGLTRGTDTANGSRISQLTFVERLYGNGAAQAADAIAVHPYSFPSLPLQTNTMVVGGFEDVPALHELMRHHGEGHKKVWITEFGAPTGTASDAVSDLDQAITFTQARKAIRRWSWAGPLIFFELRDRGTNPAIDEDNFGVLREDLTLKPAGKALIRQHSDA